MSTENASAPAGETQSSTSTSAQVALPLAAAVPAQAPAIPPGMELFDPKNPPAWFKEKLEDAKARATAQALKDLGVDDLAKAKEAIEKAKVEEEKQKTVAQKLAEREAELRSARERLASLDQAIAVQAHDAMRVLSVEQQQVVQDLAGEDAARQIQVIAKLRPTWGAPVAGTSGNGASAAAPAASVTEAARSAATLGTAAQAAPTTPIPAGATTASPGAGPPAPNAQQPKDHKAIYEEMRSVHPVKAARYMAKHFADIHKQ